MHVIRAGFVHLRFWDTLGGLHLRSGVALKGASLVMTVLLGKQDPLESLKLKLD